MEPEDDRERSKPFAHITLKNQNCTNLLRCDESNFLFLFSNNCNGIPQYNIMFNLTFTSHFKFIVINST